MTALAAVVALAPPADATQTEPIQTRARDAYVETMHTIADTFTYAGMLAEARGELGMACPVPSATFTSTWGAARSGGRSHQGVDMMADHGTVIVAPEAGVFDGNGESFYLHAGSGTTYFGTHNGGDLAANGPVTRGQPISTVSNTGNASGGSPHLHFEIHPGGGSPVDPYPATLEACTIVRSTPIESDRTDITDAERRFCLWVNNGRINARLVACFHDAEGHRQGQPGHRWVDYQREARRLRAFFAALTPPIPYESNWDRVAACESGGNWSINTGNSYYGGVQFSLPTWQSVGGTGYPHQHSKREQILRAEILRLRSGLGQWPTCGPRWYG